MNESFQISFPYILSALTGGLAAAIFNYLISKRNTKNIKKQAKTAQLNALKQEFFYALWSVEYNHELYTNDEIRDKVFVSIKTTNVERVLFGIETHLPVNPDMQLRLQNYFQHTQSLNNLIAVYSTIQPGYSAVTNYRNRLMSEIDAICTDTNETKSLRVQIDELINNLLKINM